MNKEETYRKAIICFGEDKQIIKAIEELFELSVELCKWNKENPSSLQSISSEIADVEIMLEQLKIIFKNQAEVMEEKHNKVARLEDRLNSK